MTQTLPPRPGRPAGRDPARPAIEVSANVAALASGRERSRSWGSLVFALFVFLLLGVVLPLTSVPWQTNVATTLNVVLVLVVTTYSALMIAKLCHDGGGSIIRLAFFIFLYVFMGLPVLAQVVSGQFPVSLPTTGAYTDGLIRRALEANVVSIVVFEVGSLANRFVHGKRVERDERRGRSTGPRGRWEFSQGRVLVLGVVALIATGVLIYRTGLAPFFDSREALTDSVNGTNGTVKAFAATDKAQNAIFKFAAQAPSLIALFCMLYLRHHRLWRRGSEIQRLASGLLLLLLVVANLIINNPVSNSRFWFSMVAIALVSVYVPMNRAAGIRWAAVLAVVTLLLAFTALDAFRRSGGAQDSSQGYRSDLVSSATYSAFTIELIGLRYLRTSEHTYGEQLAGTVLIFVPRSVWTGKPVDTGNLVLPYANPAAPLWTEGEVDGGVGLMAVYFLLLGVGAAAADRRMRTASVGTVVHAVIPIAAGLLIFVMRGSLAAAAPPAYALAVSVLVVARRVSAPATDRSVAAPSTDEASAGGPGSLTSGVRPRRR